MWERERQTVFWSLSHFQDWTSWVFAPKNICKELICEWELAIQQPLGRELQTTVWGFPGHNQLYVLKEQIN